MPKLALTQVPRLREEQEVGGLGTEAEEELGVQDGLLHTHGQCLGHEV